MHCDLTVAGAPDVETDVRVLADQPVQLSSLLAHLRAMALWPVTDAVYSDGVSVPASSCVGQGLLCAGSTLTPFPPDDAGTGRGTSQL